MMSPMACTHRHKRSSRKLQTASLTSPAQTHLQLLTQHSQSTASAPSQRSAHLHPKLTEHDTSNLLGVFLGYHKQSPVGLIS